MSRDAERKGFDFCGETCPAVGQAFSEWFNDHRESIPPILHAPLDELIERVKEVGTYKLRDALTEACGELLQAEGRVEDLEREVERLRGQVEELESELREAHEAAA